MFINKEKLDVKVTELKEDYRVKFEERAVLDNFTWNLKKKFPGVKCVISPADSQNSYCWIKKDTVPSKEEVKKLADKIANY